MLSTEDAVREHIRVVHTGETDAIVDGYADDAVILMTPDPIVGKDAIRALFESQHQDGSQSDVSIDQFASWGSYALVTYQGPGMQGSDTFLVRDGKIVMQSAHFVSSA